MEKTERFIVVWAEATRCAICDDKAAANDTIKNLIESNIPLEDIEAFHSDRHCQVSLSIED